MTEVITGDILDPHIRLITLLPQPGAPLSLTPYNILVNICPEFLKLYILFIPHLVRISGAMYSMVPQKVWVTVLSSIDSLHNPKSVSLTWP